MLLKRRGHPCYKWCQREFAASEPIVAPKPNICIRDPRSTRASMQQT